MPDPIEWQSARLRAVGDLTPDIRLFEIEPSGGYAPPTPGSHINVTVQIAGRPATRAYTLVGACTDEVYRIAVKRLPDSRGGSAYMWNLRPGVQLMISPPENHFELTHGRSDYLLIAGGIGITPIYTMALALHEAGANFSLLYACRSRDKAAFSDELREKLGSRLHVFISADGERIDMAGCIAGLASDGELYVCGPIGMLDAARSEWRASGRPAAALRFETFGNSGRYPAQPFTVNIPRLGLQIEIAANQSLLEGLETANVEMMFDCRRGECGLCALDIIEMQGVIDHRDVFFSDEEKTAGRKLCTCVSRMAGGTITLDTGDRTTK